MSTRARYNYGPLADRSARTYRHFAGDGDSPPSSCSLPPISELINCIDQPAPPPTTKIGHDTPRFCATRPAIEYFRADSMSPLHRLQEPTVCESPVAFSISREVNVSPSPSGMGLLSPFGSEATSPYRRSSSSAPEGGAASPVRTTPRTYRRTRQRRRGPEPKKDKEQRSRKEHRSLIQNLEDILQYLAGVYRGQYRAQTSGNATVSGLEWAKSDILCGIAAISAYHMQQLREAAIENRTLEQFERDNTRIFEDALMTQEPLSRTCLWNNGDAQCDHKDGQKVCCIHGGSDWISCRKALVKANRDRHDRKIATPRRGEIPSAKL